MNATLDGNKCCDIAEAYQNNATANACHTTATVKVIQIFECVTFFWTGSVSQKPDLSLHRHRKIYSCIYNLEARLL